MKDNECDSVKDGEWYVFNGPKGFEVRQKRSDPTCGGIDDVICTVGALRSDAESIAEDHNRRMSLEITAAVGSSPADPSLSVGEADFSSEPDEYQLITVDGFKTHVLGKRTFTCGFCVNSPNAAGFCDGECIWIADEIVKPERFIEICIHECLHAIMPELPEASVHEAAEQVAGFIAKAFKAKQATIPDLAPLLTEQLAKQLFPNHLFVSPETGVGK